MKDLIKSYQKQVDDKLKNKSFTKQDIEDFKVMINYFQHERLIHLLVTITVIFVTCFFFYLLTIKSSIILFILVIILLIMLGFYLYHYYFLENNIQELEEKYLQIKKALK
ncbi:MAG: hypothetical protein PUB03_02465 [bacterium]|jgi:hypothetical protein|nr:hypothetical protein [bacterium]